MKVNSLKNRGKLFLSSSENITQSVLTPSCDYDAQQWACTGMSWSGFLYSLIFVSDVYSLVSLHSCL